MGLHREIQPIVLPQRGKSLCSAGLADQFLCRSKTALGADHLEESGGIVAALLFRRGIDIDHLLFKAFFQCHSADLLARIYLVAPRYCFHR